MMRWRKLVHNFLIIAALALLVFYSGLHAERPAAAPIIQGQTGYDVIVVGGEPEGIAAALSAARNGQRTLLISEDQVLGGLMTLGQLNFLDMNHGPHGELLTRGIFNEFYKDLGNAFDLEEAKAWFLAKVKKEKNITLILNANEVQPMMDGNKITGVKFKQGETSQEELGLRVIDATTDADLAAQAGVPYTIGGEDYGEAGLLMGATLVFEVSGVNWDRVVQYLKYEDNDPQSGASKVAAWGYGKEAAAYKPVDKNMRFRGPNIARQKNGNVLINALLIFGVDGLDPQSKAAGIERGKQEIPHIIEFMRAKFPGFEQALLAGTAQELYIRETRHILGEYRLTITDMLENRDQWDRIGHGSYPVDVQPTSPGNFGNVIGVPDIYSIPFRSLVPLKIDNLLVVGRSASYDSLPHGSARVIPVGMVAGQAAGVASSYSIKNNLTFRELTKSKEGIAWIQNKLKTQGAYLVEYTPPRPQIMEHWAYPAVKVMRELGLIEGGYDNNYHLERKATKASLENKLNKIMRVAKERNPKVTLHKIEVPQTITRENMLQLVAESLDGQKRTPSAAQDFLQQKGILTSQLKSKFTDLKAVPDFAEMLTVLANLYEYLLKV